MEYNGLIAVPHDYLYIVRNNVVPGPTPLTLNPARIAAGATLYSQILQTDGDSLFALSEVASNPSEFTSAQVDWRVRGPNGNYLSNDFLRFGSIPFSADFRPRSHARGMPIYPHVIYPKSARIEQDFRNPLTAGAVNFIYRGMKLYEPGKRLIYQGPSNYREFAFEYRFRFTIGTFVTTGAQVDFAWLRNQSIAIDGDADFTVQWISATEIGRADDDTTEILGMGIWLKDPYGVYFSNAPIDVFYFGGFNGLPRVFWPEMTWPANGQIVFDVQNWSPGQATNNPRTVELCFGGVKRYQVSSSVGAGRRGYSPTGPDTTLIPGEEPAPGGGGAPVGGTQPSGGNGGNGGGSVLGPVTGALSGLYRERR